MTVLSAMKRVVAMRARIVKGGSCVAVMATHKGASFDFQCLLKRRPRRPLVVEVTYTTGLDVVRSAGRVTIALPGQANFGPLASDVSKRPM